MICPRSANNNAEDNTLTPTAPPSFASRSDRSICSGLPTMASRSVSPSADAVASSAGRDAYLALVPDRNAIGARRFLCHGIHNLTGCVQIRTALPLTGQCLDELDSDFDPTRHRHIARCFYRKLDLFVCGD